MIGLNHSFLADIARAPGRAYRTLALIEHVRRRTRSLPWVHEELAMFETGGGPLIQWANRNMRDTNLGPLVELLLRLTSGPFVSGDVFEGPIEPSPDGLARWLEHVIRALLAVPVTPGSLTGMVSPAPTGGADAPSFSGADRIISNWLDAPRFDQALISRSTAGTPIKVLVAAEQEMAGQMVVLPSARSSAEAWTLDCAAAELHRALLGLEEYVAAVREGLSRERCAARYHERTTFPMSQETAATWRSPTRRRQRMFVAGKHGEQYFDMHVKPGNLTRVHIWVPHADGQTAPIIYVGHCGRHLD